MTEPTQKGAVVPIPDGITGVLLSRSEYERFSGGYTVDDLLNRYSRDCTASSSEPRRKHLSNKTKAAVWAKTSGHCIYCNAELNPWRDFSIDHVIPLSKGGSDELFNLVPSCRSCNARKGAS